MKEKPEGRVRGDSTRTPGRTSAQNAAGAGNDNQNSRSGKRRKREEVVARDTQPWQRQEKPTGLAAVRADRAEQATSRVASAEHKNKAPPEKQAGGQTGALQADTGPRE